MISATDEVAVREWVKIPNISGLYRHTISGRYYWEENEQRGGR